MRLVRHVYQFTDLSMQQLYISALYLFSWLPVGGAASDSQEACGQRRSDLSEGPHYVRCPGPGRQVVALRFACQERFKVVFGDQPTASCLYRPELAGAQQVMAEFGEAANLARAARTGTTGIATATLTAHFHTMGGAGAGPVG
jgi:hypothetical protein